jgi:hypothetical protein
MINLNFKQFAGAILAACMIFNAATATAAEADTSDQSRILVYISPQDYEHSIKLWHYYDDYWYEQGPVIEPVAMEALSAEYGNVQMCRGNYTGNVLVWIKPRMYYNPQLQVFYGEVTADVFTGQGEAIGSYKGEARKLGFLDVYPEQQVEAAYKMAMQNLMVKLKANSAFQAVVSDTPTSNAKSSNAKETACSMVTLLPPAKANDWGHYLDSPRP